MTLHSGLANRVRLHLKKQTNKKTKKTRKEEKIYLVFIKWKWIVIKVFILVIFTLSRLRRRRREIGLAVSGMTEAEKISSLDLACPPINRT